MKIKTTKSRACLYNNGKPDKFTNPTLAIPNIAVRIVKESDWKKIMEMVKQIEAQESEDHERYY